MIPFKWKKEEDLWVYEPDLPMPSFASPIRLLPKRMVVFVDFTVMVEHYGEESPTHVKYCTSFKQAKNIAETYYWYSRTVYLESLVPVFQAIKDTNVLYGRIIDSFIKTTYCSRCKRAVPSTFNGLCPECDEIEECEEENE